MKDERYWDYSECLIGHPCNNCADTCSFKKKKPTIVLNDQDEKENDNYERTSKGIQGTG